MDVFSSVGVCVFFLFFLRWCILHCCTNALEKTALSHALLQNCLCAKQLPATVSKLVQFNLNTEKYEYHMIFSILKTHITTLVDCSLIAFKNCSSSFLDTSPSCLRSFSMAVSLSRSHITYFCVILKTEDPGHLHNTRLCWHRALPECSTRNSCF